MLVLYGVYSMSTGEKICVICGESCAGQPRIKNDKGQYAHQACVKAKQEQAEPEPVGIEDDDLYDDALGGGMDDLFDDIGVDDNGSAAGFSGSAMACPGCGQRMSDGAAVCMGCGYNIQSGKMISTKNKKAKGSGKGGAALGGIAKAGGFAASPMIPFVGAVIGGAIGAAIWAAIAYFTGYESGWIAWGVGVLVGMGASISPTESVGGGAITGAMAAIVAMAAITGGKYAASHFAVQDALGAFSQSEPFTLRDIDDQWFNTNFADTYCNELIDAGETIEWDNPELFVKAAYWPDDYPRDIQIDVSTKWNGMTRAEQRKTRQRIIDKADYRLSQKDVDDEWAMSVLAEDICEKKIHHGRDIDWPNPNLAMNAAEWPWDYPQSIQNEVNAKIEAMSEEDIIEYKTGMIDVANESRIDINDFTQEATQLTFIDSLKHPMNILFMFLAVITAYGIAANDE